MSNFKIETPHAAIIVWNYNDRISGDLDGTIDEEGISEKIISTVSCVSISTNKTKGMPEGSFQIVLAPTRNWVSNLTAGSWCAILMSNKPITAEDLKQANPDKVKMFGKIESVRVETVAAGDGTRQTRFMVVGTDWGHIFNNTLYIDPFIAAGGVQQAKNSSFVLQKLIFGKDGAQKTYNIRSLLSTLLTVFGKDLGEVTRQGEAINTLANSVYNFTLPKEVADYFKFERPFKQRPSRIISELINLKTGKLKDEDTYEHVNEAYGLINPLSFLGQHSLWQILLDNSNPTLNEMFNELEWTSDGKPQLSLYNRIKPFSYKKNTFDLASNLRSSFLKVKTYEIEALDVISINAGTNWRDKFNFIEIKPDTSETPVAYNAAIKTNSQVSDTAAFAREGFRPMFKTTKQFAVNPKKGDFKFDPSHYRAWSKLLSEWFFDTHRLLNGTIEMVGQTQHITVGSNIKFEAELLGVTPNINAATNKSKQNKYILAHVESVQHNFSVDEDGAREYRTSIQFVRGIIVDDNNNPIGEGALDQYISEDLYNNKKQSVPGKDYNNSVNVVSDSDKDDPNKE